MKCRDRLWTWFFLGGLSALLGAVFVTPAGVQATPFASPTPATSTINQPYVTFQSQKVVQRLFRFSDGIPIYLIIPILLVLLGLVALYLTSFRPKH